MFLWGFLVSLVQQKPQIETFDSVLLGKYCTSCSAQDANLSCDTQVFFFPYHFLFLFFCIEHSAGLMTKETFMSPRLENP